MSWGKPVEAPLMFVDMTRGAIHRQGAIPRRRGAVVVDASDADGDMTFGAQHVFVLSLKYKSGLFGIVVLKRRGAKPGALMATGTIGGAAPRQLPNVLIPVAGGAGQRQGCIPRHWSLPSSLWLLLRMALPAAGLLVLSLKRKTR